MCVTETITTPKEMHASTAIYTMRLAQGGAVMVRGENVGHVLLSLCLPIRTEKEGANIHAFLNLSPMACSSYVDILPVPHCPLVHLKQLQALSSGVYTAQLGIKTLLPTF